VFCAVHGYAGQAGVPSSSAYHIQPFTTSAMARRMPVLHPVRPQQGGSAFSCCW
jgi:hypothetical protein